jgi:hypothetical protein
MNQDIQGQAYYWYHGIDLQTVSSILGNANVRITANVYIYQIDEGKEKAAEVFEKITPRLPQNGKIENLKNLQQL